MFGILTGSANFAISVSTVDLLFDGTTTPSLSAASLLTLALSNLNLVVGVGGSGLAITAGNVGIAAIKPPDASSGDHRIWVAVDATGLAATLNLGSSVTASVSNVAVQINQESGNDASDQPGSPLDWTKDVLQNNGGTESVYTVNPATNLPGASPPNLSITFTAKRLTVSGSLTNLNIFNLITGSADFYAGVTTTDVTLAGSTPNLTDATLLTFALGNLNMQVGYGGYGLTFTGGDLGLAVITPNSANVPQGATDNRHWLALDGSIQSVTLDLGPNIASTLPVTNVSVAINQATGAYTSSGGTTTPATALDWTQFHPAIDPGMNLPTPSSLPIDFTQKLIQVQATVVLSIGGYAYIAGNVSFTKTGPLSATSVAGGAPIEVNALEIGASDVYAFFGTGGPYWNADGTPATNSARPWGWRCRISTSVWHCSPPRRGDRPTSPSRRLAPARSSA